MCDEQREALVHAYADGELDAASTLETEQHLRECESCSKLYDSIVGLRRALRSGGVYYTAPANIVAKSRRAAGFSRNKAARANRGSIRQFGFLQWSAIAAVFIIGCFVGRLYPRQANLSAMSDEAVAGHVRSLLASHLTDVASSDKHTVKPWFAGKLDYVPPVVDLAGEGYPLIGGRLDYLHGRTVAALVYKVRAHTVNVFIWPRQEAEVRTENQRRTRTGYSVVNWTDGGLSYSAVSDVNLADLKHLTAALRAGITKMQDGSGQ